MTYVNNPFRNVIGVILLIIAIGGITGSLIMSRNLLSPVYWLWIISLIVSIALSLPMRSLWKWLTGCNAAWITIILNTLFFTPVICCIALIINFSGQQDSIREDAVVTRLYTETRHQTKRVSRKHYVQGPPYKVYFMELNLSSSGKVNVETTHKIYKILMKGDEVSICRYRGLLGLSYVDPKSIEYSEKYTSERKVESMREKRHRKYKEHINKIRNHNKKTTD